MDDVAWNLTPMTVVEPVPLVAVVRLVDPEGGFDDVGMGATALKAKSLLRRFGQLRIPIPLLHFGWRIRIFRLPRRMGIAAEADRAQRRGGEQQRGYSGRAFMRC